MLRTGVTHPQILEALAAAGHGSLVLISDGNFPSLTAPHPGARRVYLNLRPGLVTATDVLAALKPVIQIEQAVLMEPDDAGEPAVHRELVGLLDPETLVVHVSRQDFYTATCSADLALVIASGDQRWYANILLTIGPLPEEAVDRDPAEAAGRHGNGSRTRPAERSSAPAGPGSREK